MCWICLLKFTITTMDNGKLHREGDLPTVIQYEENGWQNREGLLLFNITKMVNLKYKDGE